jgi:hypothetical protein
MGADRGIEHGTATAWSNNSEVPWPLREGTGDARNHEKCAQYRDIEFHRLLRLSRQSSQ